MGVGWEEDKRCVTYGLEPFVFDPGPQTSQEELARDAEKRVRSDKRFREVLSKEKAAITAVLQGCLEKVNGQLERGEEVCQKAHFPLLNPRDFEDMESFARHDHFTVDLRIDKVDESLQKLVSSLLGIVWTNIQVENETKAKSLERFSQALQERMETLEYHLNDRSRQLSNCRYAYFLEITHLRNQLYIKNQSDDENFEPVEAYFFDPTEYLEEELRQQLNDKITLSVKVYKEKLNAKCREVADLELQLETLQALNAQRNDDNLENYLQIACNKHGAKNVVETLAQLAEKEMHQWAQNVRGGKTPQANAEGLEGSFSPARLEQMRQAMMQAAQEAEEERALRRQAEEALREAQKELEELTRALEEQKLNDAGQAVPKAAAPLVQARSLVDPSEMDELRKELARIKLQLEKERSKSAELQLLQETKASETRAKLEDYDDTHAVLKEAQEVHKTAESAGPTETLSACAEQVVTALKERSEELESLRSFSKSKSALALSEPASRQDSKSRMSSRQTTREFTKAEEHQEVEQSDGEERGPGEGCQHDEAQTRITASGNCFYLLEALETAEEEAIKAQLEELQECMDSAWDAALGAIRGSLKPPKGTGTNRSSRGAFLRLFHGVRSRLTRYELLVEQINSMRRAELEQVLEGTHFLMESSLPDEDVGLRDSIFGKGITKVMLEETRHPLDFATLVKRWSGHCGRIVGHLVRSRASIFLETHPGRRIFIPLPGTVPSHDGGTGGGLQARQRKDFSPTRQKLYDGLSDYEAHSPCSTMRGRRCSPSRSPVRVPRCLSPPRSARSARSESRARSPSGDGIAVEGRALQSFAADGSPISLARFIRHASGCGLDWERCVSAPEGLQPTEGVEGDSLLRNRSPDSGELSEAEKEAARARREARAGKMREEVLERLAAEADKWHALGVSGIPASRQEADLSGLPIGEPRPARPAEEPPKESEECAHPTAHDLPVPFGDVGLMAAARPRPKLQKEQRLPIFSQGQKGPAFQMPSVGQWQPLTHGAAATDRDRSLERERQRWCDISSGPLGPMPTWEYEEATESKRPLGGTYTTIKLRPGSAQASKVQDGGAQPAPPPKPRPVSAQDQLETPQMCSSSSAVSVGRLRPGVGIARSQSSGALQGPLSVYGYKKSKGLPPPRRPTSSPSLR